MTMLETVRDLQTRYLDGVKTAMPKREELSDSWSTYVTDLYEANREFASRLAKAWDRADNAEVTTDDEATDGEIIEAADQSTDGPTEEADDTNS